jgi:para-aminobenzoate synthetase component 1
MAAVRKTKAYIQQGDIYQLNLSQQFQAKSGLSACQIYRRLRRLSPAGFSAYLDCGDFQVLSSSPERFLQAGAGRVITRPMKGTRPRGKDICEDRRLRNELYQSPKDKAELLMITDLERNDLGRVCAYGTVKVARLRQIEQYSGVFQTTSSVQARLSRHQDRFDLLAATFPGGSVTGCPKIRAMQLIEELEPHRRGIYTGSLGYLSFCGNMDFNILIRSLLKKGKEVFFWAGSGIVADSLPEEEYEETLVKAKAMQEAINGVGLWNQG